MAVVWHGFTCNLLYENITYNARVRNKMLSETHVNKRDKVGKRVMIQPFGTEQHCDLYRSSNGHIINVVKLITLKWSGHVVCRLTSEKHQSQPSPGIAS
jgi:hypothetical protein